MCEIFRAFFDDFFDLGIEKQIVTSAKNPCQHDAAECDPEAFCDPFQTVFAQEEEFFYSPEKCGAGDFAECDVEENQNLGPDEEGGHGGERIHYQDFIVCPGHY